MVLQFNECNTRIYCTYRNTLQQVYDDNTNPKRKFADANSTILSCNTYSRSEIK